MKGVSFGAFSGYTTCGDHPMAQFYSLTFPVCNSLTGGVLNVVVQLDRACFPRKRRESTTKSAETTAKSAERDYEKYRNYHEKCSTRLRKV